MKKNLLASIMNFPMSIKNLRRWPRVLFAVIYLFAVYLLLLIVYEEYILTDASSVSNNDKGGVVFGLSLVTEKPQSFLTGINADEKNKDWSTSFLLQSQSPSIQVFLDYISIYANVSEPEYCFTSFRLGKDIGVPFQVISEIKNNKEFGILENANNLSDEYIFRLKDKLCLKRENKYFLPHVFLGIIASETYANLGVATIAGHRAFEFFPFEEQKMVFDLTTQYLTDDQSYLIVRPNLEISIFQQGWIGKFKSSTNGIDLHLKRPSFYRAILTSFSVIMFFLVLFLNNIIDVAGGYFEVSFGLLLGLWGTHEILIPNHIESSVPIDIIIYILYALTIGEIITVFIDEFIVNWGKRKVRIVNIVKGGIRSECVAIKNNGFFPVDMTSWVLFDEVGHKFKFPLFILKGKGEVKVWTSNQDHEALKSQNSFKHMVWGRKQSVWNNRQDTAYLEDDKGEIVDQFSYKKER